MSYDRDPLTGRKKRFSLEEKFLSKLPRSRDPGECWNWQGEITPPGYGRLVASNTRVLAHRYSLSRHLGAPIPRGAYVLHSCDNRSCVNPAHLSTGDQRRNINEMYARGRGVDNRGESHGMHKLTVDNVRMIRELRGVETNVSIAAKFGVTASCVSGIHIGRAWRFKEAGFNG